MKLIAKNGEEYSLTDIMNTYRIISNIARISIKLHSAISDMVAVQDDMKENGLDIDMVIRLIAQETRVLDEMGGDLMTGDVWMAVQDELVKEKEEEE